jgi:hypothetical protein
MSPELLVPMDAYAWLCELPWVEGAVDQTSTRVRPLRQETGCTPGRHGGGLEGTRRVLRTMA